MQNRLKIALVVAVFFGLIAAYGIYNFLRQQREASEALKTATQDVVVAGKDIAAGSTITEAMLKDNTIKAVKWPKASVPVGSFSDPKQVVGKVNRVKILANEPILESRLAGEGAGLTVRLEPGKRAMAVRVDEIVGVSGFIVPDDRVDVILTTTPIGGGDTKVSKIVLQNKRVLSVAQSTEQKDGKPQIARSITLEVTPEEAEKLSLASQEGQIVLALRGLGDDALATTTGSRKGDLLAIAVARKPAPGKPAIVPPEKYKIEVIHGSERKVVEF
ncbi:MAG TPA: Flp pilus assembly protein CpaB [candidate division Zixibacteria bacterium]|nr:Flp pilus assembly protein CpaB [candidate division Zixibacteria bacterium]